MSRIGKIPIKIPENTKVSFDGKKIVIEGPKGRLEKEIPPFLELKIEEKEIKIFPKEGGNLKEKKKKAIWGTFRQIIHNMIVGVTQGFEKKLQISGLGYRARMEGQNLVLEVGFSHPVVFTPPPQVKITVEKDIISVSGIDKELVGEVAAKIRDIKPCEPYKGKGIKYLDEEIIRKIPKKAKAAK